MRIVHLSDLHFTTFFSNNNLSQIEQVLKYAINMKGDHIVITGDLTDNATPEDFLILRKLFEKLELIDGNRFSLVIGNHDIFGGVQTAEDIFTFPEKCSKINYNQKVQEFYSYFPELFDNSIYFDQKQIFPFAKLIDNFLLVGLNSIAPYSKVNNPFASNGKIELSQLNDMVKIFEQFENEKYRKIVLVHHHFNKMKIKENLSNNFWQKIEKQTMKLKKKKRLFKIFNQYGVELVLHGHYHISKDYVRKGIRFSNAGASLKGAVKDNYYVNVININDKSIDINIVNLPARKKIKSASLATIENNLSDNEEFELIAV